MGDQLARVYWISTSTIAIAVALCHGKTTATAVGIVSSAAPIMILFVQRLALMVRLCSVWCRARVAGT